MVKLKFTQSLNLTRAPTHSKKKKNSKHGTYSQIVVFLSLFYFIYYPSKYSCKEKKTEMSYQNENVFLTLEKKKIYEIECILSSF